MTIEIDRTAELYQQADGGFKFAGYFSEQFAEQFLAMKRQAKERGCKMGLSLIIEHATIQPASEIVLSEIEDDLERTLAKIKEMKAGSVGDADTSSSCSPTAEAGPGAEIPVGVADERD